MRRRSKSEIQFAYHSYAMALLHVTNLFRDADALNALLAKRRSELQNSFSVKLQLLRLYYDLGSSSYKIVTVDHNNPFTMKTLSVIALVFLLLTSCSGPHWYTYKQTGTGRYGYMTPGWPAVQSCAGMNHRNPVKNATVRRYHWSPKHVKQ